MAFVKTKSKEKHKEQKQHRKKAKEKKEKKKEKKSINQDRRRARENTKEKQVLWTRQCLNNVQNCRKEEKKRRAIVTWLRHGGCEMIAHLSY